MVYTYVLTKEAEREFDRELAYSEEHWGTKHARQYAAELRHKLRSIAQTPQMYAQRSDILPGIRICHYKGNKIIYAIIEQKKQVIVVGLLSNHQPIMPDILHKRLS